MNNYLNQGIHIGILDSEQTSKLFRKEEIVNEVNDHDRIDIISEALEQIPDVIFDIICSFDYTICGIIESKFNSSIIADLCVNLSDALCAEFNSETVLVRDMISRTIIYSLNFQEKIKILKVLGNGIAVVVSDNETFIWNIDTGTILDKIFKTGEFLHIISENKFILITENGYCVIIEYKNHKINMSRGFKLKKHLLSTNFISNKLISISGSGILNKTLTIYNIDNEKLKTHKLNLYTQLNADVESGTLADKNLIIYGCINNNVWCDYIKEGYIGIFNWEKEIMEKEFVIDSEISEVIYLGYNKIVYSLKLGDTYIFDIETGIKEIFLGYTKDKINYAKLLDESFAFFVNSLQHSKIYRSNCYSIQIYNPLSNHIYKIPINDYVLNMTSCLTNHISCSMIYGKILLLK